MECNVNDLPTGDYKIELKGKYHATYMSESIALESTNKQVNVSTSSQSFTYVDVNEDGVVGTNDLSALEEEDIKNEVHNRDLTGDGVVDVTDLALVHINLGIPIKRLFLTLASFS